MGEPGSHLPARPHCPQAAPLTRVASRLPCTPQRFCLRLPPVVPHNLRPQNLKLKCPSILLGPAAQCGLMIPTYGHEDAGGHTSEVLAAGRRRRIRHVAAGP